MTGRWEPLARGERATHVWATIAELGDELARYDAPAADLAVWWDTLAGEIDDDIDPAIYETIDRTLDDRRELAAERFTAELERGYAHPALFRGLAGAGWAATLVASDADELLDKIDAHLAQVLETASSAGSFDLISGAAGFACYFLERDDGRALALAVDYFAARAVRSPEGVAWHTPAELLADDLKARYPDGAFDCGVAHGAAGVIGVLSRIAARSDAPAAAAPLAADATRWLLARRRAGRFPALVHGDRRDEGRDAWCYGAPGIALALGRPDLAAGHTQLTDDELDVVGPGLCHGAAGRLHAANRLYQATRDPAHLGAALAWLDRVLVLPRPFAMPETGERRAAILTGVAGIALALLATVSAQEPAWDRRMLCDLPVLPAR